MAVRWQKSARQRDVRRHLEFKHPVIAIAIEERRQLAGHGFDHGRPFRTRELHRGRNRRRRALHSDLHEALRRWHVDIEGAFLDLGPKEAGIDQQRFQFLRATERKRHVEIGERNPESLGDDMEKTLVYRMMLEATPNTQSKVAISRQDSPHLTQAGRTVGKELQALLAEDEIERPFRKA